MSLPHALLGLLLEKPMTGYSLKQIFDRSIQHFWQAHLSQIYRELNKLENQQLLQSSIEPQEGKPDRRIYHVTPAGKTVFLDWLHHFPDELKDPVRCDFVTRMFFGSYLDRTEWIFQLTRFRNDKLQRLAALEAVDALISDYSRQFPDGEQKAVFWRFTLRKGLKVTRVSIEWAEECLEALQNQPD